MIGHSLRGTSATIDAAENDVPIEQLMDIGGWVSPAVARDYIRKSINYKTTSETFLCPKCENNGAFYIDNCVG